jgi:hypothetical protein
VARRRLDTVPAVSEVDLVEIRLEDLRFRVAPFHLTRGALLAKLPRNRFIAPVDEIGVHVADELLRDCARAARTAEEVVLDRTGDADDVDAVVLIEAVVFYGDERLR